MVGSKQPLKTLVLNIELLFKFWQVWPKFCHDLIDMVNDAHLQTRTATPGL